MPAGGWKTKSLQVKGAPDVTSCTVIWEEPPKTRGDCVDGPRPCPWVRCKHHLYADVHPRSGSLKIRIDVEGPWQMAGTCTLDAADQGLELEEIGALMGMTKQATMNLEVKALKKLRRGLEAMGWDGDEVMALLDRAGGKGA